MKKVIFIVILLASGFSIKAQVIAVKTKTFYWGSGDFHQVFTDSGKKIFDSLFKHISIDTINCVKIKPDQELGFLSGDYLSKHNYQYLTIYRYGDNVSVSEYDNVVYNKRDGRKKVLLKYSKDFNNKIDRMSVYIMD